MKYMLKQHPQWHELGLAYDSGSSLYTSERLQFPEEDTHPRPGRERERERDPASKDADLDYTSKSSGGFTDSPQYEYDIAWPGSNEVSLKVVVAPVSHIIPPIIGRQQDISCLHNDRPLYNMSFSSLDNRRQVDGGKRAGCGHYYDAQRAGGDGQAPPHRRDGAGRGAAVLC